MDFLDGVERMGALGPYKVTDDRGRAVLAGTVKTQDGWHPDAAARGGGGQLIHPLDGCFVRLECT